MIVGFTGTREGMSERQRQLLRAMLQRLYSVMVYGPDEPNEFHHGSARGADAEAIAVASAIGYQDHGYPAGADPLRRNRAIVAAVDILIAAPRQDKEELRSGTWATVRYARAKGIPIVMLPR